LLLHPEDDDDIIAWLEKQPRGKKSEAVREKIRVGLRTDTPRSTNVDAQTIRQIIREELSRAQITVSENDESKPSPSITEDVDPEAGRLLDAMF
jgi:hypothetical protein